MRRFHMSDTPDLVPRSVDPAEEWRLGMFKPFGLWYDVDGDWFRWLLEEGYDDPAAGWLRPYLYELRVDTSRLTTIRTLKQFDAFHARYRKPIADGLWIAKGIQWSAVARVAAGVEIAPYLWERRLHWESSWYYGWDCASGVIWDVSAILGLEQVASGLESVAAFARRLGVWPEVGSKAKRQSTSAGQFWRPSEGSNRVRVLPHLHPKRKIDVE